MSDEYDEYGGYDQYGGDQGGQDYGDYGDMGAGEEVEEDYQTKVELEYFEAQELLRKDEIDKCITMLEELYDISIKQELKNWKVKILNLLLQIYCRANNPAKINQTLQRIQELNQKEKYTENSIKSIILTIKSLPVETFKANKEFVYGFIGQLDNLGKVRSYLLFLQKAVEEGVSAEAQALIKMIKNILQETPNVPASNLLQLFSFQIAHSKKTGQNISHQIRKIQLKLPSLQAESYMCEGHISIIKQAVAQNLYLEDNYLDCATYLCEAFQDNMKYGKSLEIKKTLLKTNVLVALLTDNKEVYLKEKACALYNEAAATFKGEADIQALHGMVQAWVQCDCVGFESHSKSVQLNLQAPYQKLLQTALERLKMRKLLQVIKPYTSVKGSYLQRRLSSSREQVERMLFSLITDNKIKGRIKQENGEVLLEMMPKEDEFLSIQLSNIREISRRYL